MASSTGMNLITGCAKRCIQRDEDWRRILRAPQAVPKLATDGRGEFCVGLTFELRGCQRQDASARPVKMYRVPPAGRWWPAVGAPFERGVRFHPCCGGP
jgi:hypothetical protein